MHVFLSETGSENALHVSTKSGTAFTVEASADALMARGKTAASVNSEFSYRIVSEAEGQGGPLRTGGLPEAYAAEETHVAIDQGPAACELKAPVVLSSSRERRLVLGHRGCA